MTEVCLPTILMSLKEYFQIQVTEITLLENSTSLSKSSHAPCVIELTTVSAGLSPFGQYK